MRYGSVCSGIEAASVAWEPLDWHASFLSEIDAFPRAVLKHHYPDVHLHGDFTTIQADQYEPIDLLVGGTPCQSFSVAGLRGGLADERGNLALEYLRLASRLRPRWVLWENVPGVLSSNGGRDFGAFLGGLEELGYGWSYRTLDAQFFGLAQRRKRVFVVGYLGDWRRAAAVLFEPASLRGHPAPRREKGEGIAGTLAAGAHPSGFNGRDAERGNIVAHSLRAEGFGASEDGTGRGVPLVFPWMQGGSQSMKIDHDICHTLIKSHQPAVAFAQNSSHQGDSVSEDFSPTLDKSKTPAVMTVALRGREGGGTAEVGGDVATALRASTGGGDKPHILTSAVRRLTPRECERLQGFPDNYTAVPWNGWRAMDASETPEGCRAQGMQVRQTKKGKWRVNDVDGPRYKALGNSMAVPVMRWIGRRIAAVDGGVNG